MKTRTYMRLTNTTSAPAIKFIPCFHLHFDEIFSFKIVFLNVFLMTSSATSIVCSRNASATVGQSWYPPTSTRLARHLVHTTCYVRERKSPSHYARLALYTAVFISKFGAKYFFTTCTRKLIDFVQKGAPIYPLEHRRIYLYPPTL